MKFLTDIISNLMDFLIDIPNSEIAATIIHSYRRRKVVIRGEMKTLPLSQLRTRKDKLKNSFSFLL